MSEIRDLTLNERKNLFYSEKTVDNINIDAGQKEYLKKIGFDDPNDLYKEYKKGNFNLLKSIVYDPNFEGDLNAMTKILYSASLRPSGEKIDQIYGKLVDAFDDPDITDVNPESFTTRRKKEIIDYLRIFGYSVRPDEKILMILKNPRGSDKKEIPENAVPEIKKQILKSYIDDVIFKSGFNGASVEEIMNNGTIKKPYTITMEDGTEEVDEDQLKRDVIEILDEGKKEGEYTTRHVIGKKNVQYELYKLKNEKYVKRILDSNPIMIGRTRSNNLFKHEIKIGDKVPENWRGLFMDTDRYERIMNGEHTALSLMMTPTDKDIDKVIDILDINVKNGFAPIGYNYNNDHALNSNELIVLLKPPVSASNRVLKPYNVQINNDSVVLKFSKHNSKIDKQLPFSIWNNKDVTYRRNNGITTHDIKVELLKLRDNEYFDKFIEKTEYVGDVCINTKQDPISLRSIKDLKKHLENTINLFHEFYTSRSTKFDNDKVDDIINKPHGLRSLMNILDIEYNIQSQLETPLVKAGNIYRRTSPLCELADFEFDEDQNDYIITIPKTIVDKYRGKVLKNTYVSPIYEKFVDMQKECHSDTSCLDNKVIVTQNLTNQRIGTSSEYDIPAVSNVAKIIYQFNESLRHEREKNLRKLAFMYEFNIQRAKDNDINTKSKRREALRDAILWYERELNADKWDFLDELRGKLFRHLQ